MGRQYSETQRTSCRSNGSCSNKVPLLSRRKVMLKRRSKIYSLLEEIKKETDEEVVKEIVKEIGGETGFTSVIPNNVGGEVVCCPKKPKKQGRLFFVVTGITE